jgi:hypothetical protein
MADEDVVRVALANHETLIYQAVHEAWGDWKALQLAGRLMFMGRSRACLVYDFIVQRVRSAFDGNKNVRVITRDETAKFLFNDQVVVRFKKANENGLGSNIETQATMDFVDQQQELPGIPDVHKVEILYVLNRFQTHIDQVQVVARDGNTILWNYVLAPAESAGIVPLPLTPAAEPERRAKIKLRAAKGDQQKDAGEL